MFVCHHSQPLHTLNIYSLTLLDKSRSGIGRELTLAALARGDKVIATTRAQSFDAIKDLKTLGADIFELDVTAHIDELRRISAEAVKVYGHVDVVINNAGKFSMAVGAKGTLHSPFKRFPHIRSSRRTNQRRYDNAI